MWARRWQKNSEKELQVVFLYEVVMEGSILWAWEWERKRMLLMLRVSSKASLFEVVSGEVFEVLCERQYDSVKG